MHQYALGASELNHQKVLAITKRTRELCGTLTLACNAGLDLVTATDMNVARVIIDVMQVRGVVICWDSWTPQERESMLAELAAKHPELTVTLRCPGCTRCDLGNLQPGTLNDVLSLTQLMKPLTPSAEV